MSQTFQFLSEPVGAAATETGLPQLMPSGEVLTTTAGAVPLVTGSDEIIHRPCAAS